MNDLPYWGIAAIQIWICTRELSYVQKRLTGDAQRDERYGWDVLAEFEIDKERPLVVLQEQAKAELLAKLRSGELQAKGIKCDRRNKGNPVSDTAEDIPVCDWGCLRIGCLRHLPGDRYAAFFDDNYYPSWRHIVCPGAMIRQLWPQDQTETPEAAPTSQAAPAPAKRKRVSQQSVAEEVGKEVFPCGAPASMTTQQIVSAIAERLEADHPHIAKIIKPKTLARVACCLRKTNLAKLDNKA